MLDPAPAINRAGPLCQIGTGDAWIRHTGHVIRTNPQLFHEIFEAIEEVVWVYDAINDRVEYLSPSFDRIYGRQGMPPPQTAAEGLALIHPVDRERVQDARTAMRATGTLDQTYRIMTTDGAIRWMHDRGTAIRDAQGRVTRVFGVAADITDRRHLEDQLRQAQKMDAFGLRRRASVGFSLISTTTGASTTSTRPAGSAAAASRGASCPSSPTRTMVRSGLAASARAAPPTLGAGP